MEGARATWTDERLDDLSRGVESGFARVDGDLRTLRSDMNSRFDHLEMRLDGRFGSLERRADGIETRLERRFDQLQSRIYFFGSGLLVAVLASNFLSG